MHRYLVNRAASTIDDLWDFGTVRNVQPRGGTLRKHQAAMAAAATNNPPPVRPARADRDQPPAPGTGVRVRDYAVNPPKTQVQPDAFDTVRQAPSAHSEYSEFSSSASVPGDARARIELDREKVRIERERQLQVQKEQQQSAARTAIQHSKSRSWDSVGSSVEHNAVGAGNGRKAATAGPPSVHSSDEEEGDLGSIMDTVVIPVLDSVRHTLLRSLIPRLRLDFRRFTTGFPMFQHRLPSSDFEERFKKLKEKFPDSSMFSYQRLSIQSSQKWMIESGGEITLSDVQVLCFVVVCLRTSSLHIFLLLYTFRSVYLIYPNQFTYSSHLQLHPFFL